MSQYQQYEAEDFATDDYFRKWVLDPDVRSVLFWEAWLAEHPQQAETIRQARHLLLAVSEDAHTAPKATVQRLWRTIESGTVRSGALSGYYASRRWWQPVAANPYRVAASLLILLVAGSVLYYYWYLRVTEMAYATRFGEIRRVQLPDGSVAVLNANSRLSFPADWDERHIREVHVQGEAFFAVKKKEIRSGGKMAKIKFVVNTADLRIEVLGTQFNVTNRRNTTAVVLRSGQVKLALKGPENRKVVLMKPGDLVSYSRQGQSLRKNTVNPDQYDTWKEKRWIFKGATLRDIAFRLEETYGLTVQWGNESLKDRTVSGVIPTDNLEMVLQALSVSLNLHITREHDQIMMKE